MNAAHRATLIQSIAWCCALATAAILLAVTGFASRDPDSTVYTQLTTRMAVTPVLAWIAPDWGGSWGLSGPFREHPIGIFILPALLARAGYPAEQAAFAVGAAFSVCSLLLLGRVAAQVLTEEEAVAIQWAALILPIAFVYRVRANQEYPVLALTLFAVYSTQRARRSAVWIWGVIGAACAVALVKGIFVVFVPGVCAIWLVFIPDRSSIAPHESGRLQDVAAWAGLLWSIAAVLALALIYEWTYRRATGDSFLWFYVHDRIAENAGLTSTVTFNLATRLYNLAWYTARVVWFAVPGSLVLIWSVKQFKGLSSETRRAMLFPLTAAATYVAAMSLGASKADRFIFPAYFFIGALGAAVAIRRWTVVNRLARRLAALPPYSLPLGWLLFFLVTLAGARHLPYIKL